MGKLYYLPRRHCSPWLRILPLLGIFVLVLALIYSLYSGGSAQALALKQGSFGSEVKALQRELQNQGFYSGDIDGIYGANTIRAVRNMQQQYGLKADGIAGPQTLQALGLVGEKSEKEAYSGVLREPGSTGVASPSSALRQEDITLLARAIQAEAEGEPYIGKVAVGAVLLNRLKHPDFPNTLAGVVYQGQAMESVANGRINISFAPESLRAAQDAAAGWDPTYGCLYFWNPAKSTSAWIWTRKIAVTYGNHVFGT
jgi:N-acetylmuramoyl-L-alanine amidase